MLELFGDLANVRWWVWLLLFGGMFWLVTIWALCAISDRADEQIKEMIRAKDLENKEGL